MSSEELCFLCNDYFSHRNSPEQSLVPLQRYFAKLINSNQMVELTPLLKSYIPALASEQDGVLCPMLTATINGLSPVDYVPQLKLRGPQTRLHEPLVKSLSARNPRMAFTRDRIKAHHNKAKSEIENLETHDLNDVPKTSRPLPNANALITARTSRKPGLISYHKPLPPLNQTESDVLSHLYVSSHHDFFVGKRVSEESHDWHIVPSTYPEHLIGKNFNVIASTGVVTLNDDASGVVQDLHNFIRDKENLFIVENQMISKRVSYKSFYVWKQRLRERLFAKIINTFNTHNAVAVPNFNAVVEQIKTDVMCAFEDAAVFTKEFDAKNDDAEFTEMQEIATQVAIDIDKKVSVLKDQVGQQISEVFRVVNASNVLIQLGFEELNSLNELPPSLKQYASDLKWRIPSLWREKMREKQLNYERKLARERLAYLGKFFTRVRICYNGILILKCKDMIMGFFDRYLPEPVNHRRPHRIEARFNEKTGIDIIPNRTEYIKWVQSVMKAIKSSFFQNLDTIWSDLILKVDPNYEYQIENPITVVERFQELQEQVSIAIDSINDAYNYFETEISYTSKCVLDLVNKIEESRSFKDCRNIEELQKILNNLIRAKDNLMKRPKNIFHHPRNTTESMNDFTVTLSQALDDITDFYNAGMDTMKAKVINELNVLFNEINDKWSAVKDKKITRSDSREIEAKTLQYSLICDLYCSAWSESFSDVKASFDTVMKMYRQLADSCRYTHSSAAKHFNKVAETLGLGAMPIVEEEEEEEEEDEYEEEYEEEDEE